MRKLDAGFSTAFGLCLTAALALGGAVPVYGAERSGPQGRQDQPTIVGHRGSAGLSPENTVAGFEQARNQGADLFEVDVQLSSDGEIFLFHDATGARTSNVAEVFPERAGDPITSFSAAELSQLDAGSYFGEAFVGEPIPDLRDAVQVTNPRTGINIELKSPENSPGVEVKLAEALGEKRYWQRLIARDQIVVSSFDEASLRTFHNLMPHIPVLLVGEVPDDAGLAALAGWADGLVTNYRTLDPADVARVQAAGLTLDVYTVNSVDAMQRMTALGVDSIITDFPGVLSALQQGRNPLPEANGIEVSTVVADPPGNDVQPQNGEYVVLTNTGNVPVDVSGYVLQDAVINRLTVGSGYVLSPGGELRVYTGPGTNTANRYYNNRTTAVLNNTGDSLAIFTPDGTFVDLYAY